MNKKIVRILYLLAIYSSAIWAQVSYDNWDFKIKAENSILIDTLAVLGIRPDATSDFDSDYDIPRPPRAPSGNYLEIYFPHSGGSYPPLLGTRYAVDFQGPDDPTWDMSVESSTSEIITLRWDSSYIRSIEKRVQLFLLDLTNSQLINMREQGSYSFDYINKRDFKIIGAIKVELKYLMESFWNGVNQIRDTVKMYLAQSSSPFSFMDSVSVYLSDVGEGSFVFTSAPTDNYYLVVRHRNHLEVWSSNPQYLIKGTTSFSTYNFTSSVNQAYGTNALKQEGTVFVSWCGDVNHDGVVDFLDRNETWNDRGTSGYKPTDCNGDGQVDSNDYSIVLANRLKIRQRP